jgi:CRISPR/Cas system-associated exonuclease Cas4 (RecB family)
MIKSWSFSSLMLYEKCPRAAFYKLVERIPEPEPEPDSPLVRGNRIHSQIERYIKGGQQPEDTTYNPNLLYKVQNDYQLGFVEVEGEWGFDRDWNRVDWRAATCRMKLDAGVVSPGLYTVYDWKTGKKIGNEIKHTMQGQLYAIGAQAIYPETLRINVGFHYVDHPDEKPLTATYNPSQIARFKETYNRRSAKMMSDTEFRPVPNKGNCKWCPFNQHCQTAVI